MKKYLRILKIWYHGKLPYAKRVRTYIKGQFFRDLYQESSLHMDSYVQKYGAVK